eukprot:TRINITY_DN14711_c0_g1_i1.p1 TRINITY_DN14711_c0_g1~~TRINITY_DN14711_c0_g1_i1.p1  ORF type:complete len:93 (-),score=18.54 TRINITY_DN14711_c0_g1_i1:284-538(-)
MGYIGAAVGGIAVGGAIGVIFASAKAGAVCGKFHPRAALVGGIVGGVLGLGAYTLKRKRDIARAREKMNGQVKRLMVSKKDWKN